MWSMKEHKIKIDYLEKQKEKEIMVYLPNNYETSGKSYPVVYFHDGKAVFFGKTPFGTGSFEVLDTLTRMERENLTDGFIVVAINNAETERADEYLPFKASYKNMAYNFQSEGGKADFYADFLVKEVKPFIEKTYRVQKENSAIIGSSMGGVITAYIVSKYPNEFSKAGVLSIASWVFTENEWADYLEKTTPNKNMKYFVYVGAKEGHIPSDFNLAQQYVDDSIAYFEFLIRKGVPLDNIKFKMNVNNAHNETAWSNYIEPFLLF